MDIAFSLRGIDGHVAVTYAANDRPELRGASPDAAGFPFCHATVDYPAQGYDAVLGWVQLVRSDDNVSHGREFEVDPLDFLGEVPHPFCWIGLRPELFDAPSRSPRVDMDWAAHSFLCVPDGRDDGGMEARALLGFAWAFRVRDGEITLEPPALLSAADWDADVAILEPLYPAWRFVSGFRVD
jgi:hypothetical protein